MAKKKQDSKKIGFMLMLIAIVWGAVFFQIFFNKNSNQPVTNNIKAAKQQVKTIETPKAYQLKSNYIDPFLGQKYTNGKATKKVVKQKKTSTKAALTDYSNIIKYQGNISNKNSQTVYVSFSKKSHLLQKGDSLSVYKLIKIKKDSIQFSAGRIKFWIKKQTN